MADGAVREGAVTVHSGPGVAVIVTGTGAGSEVPAGHTQSGCDLAKDAYCRRWQEAKNTVSADWEKENTASELKRKSRKLKRISC